MRRSILIAWLALAFVAPACSGGSPPADGTVGPSGSPAVNATSAPLLPTDAEALPAVTLATFQQLLDQLRGTPVLVNVWGSWCGPCTEEAPDLAWAAGRYGARVQFLGLDILDDRPSARTFMRRFGWRYPSLYDADGAVRNGLGFIGQPVTVIYDRAGTRTFTWIGPTNRDLLRQHLEPFV